jgi:hypothetical protein
MKRPQTQASTNLIKDAKTTEFGIDHHFDQNF